jgi:hypothetical protein
MGWEESVTEASRHLVGLAGRVAAEYADQTGPRAILLTGSAAKGVSDYFSDLDLIAYYARLPSPDQLAAARASIHATNIHASPVQELDSTLEEYVLQGVECQVAHLTIAAWERDMASVLEKSNAGTHIEKALAGLLDGVSLHGGDLNEL